MDDRTDGILALTPQLRRHARLLTGSQIIGDEYVRICLEAVLEEPDRLAGDDLKTALFRVFHSIWDTINAHLDGGSPLEQPDPAKRLEKGLMGLAPVDRRALLLVTLEGCPPHATADILGLGLAETIACIERARERLGRWSSVAALIVEDESVFALEIAAILEEMGHTVLCTARTIDEAIAATRRHQPGLVLADIELANDDDGIAAAQRILKLIDVPLIFVTAHPERLLTGGRPEPAFVVPKPLSAEALRVAIAHVLALYDSPDQAAQHRKAMLDKLSRLTGNVIPFPDRRSVRP